MVQLYVKHLKSKVERPREELEKIQRVMVEARQTNGGDSLPASRLAYSDTKAGEFRVEAEPVN